MGQNADTEPNRRDLDDDYRAACRGLVSFTKSHGIKKVRWENVGNLSMFQGLTRRRWTEQIQNGLATHEETKRRAIELWRAVETNSPDVFECLGLTVRDGRIIGSTVPTPSPNAGLNFGDDPHALAECARQLAGRGMTGVAFRLLTTSFGAYASEGMDRAICLLPTILYFGYRYMEPQELTRTLRNLILKYLCPAPRGTRISDKLRSLCLAQAAFTFSEYGVGKRATDLLNEREIWSLTEPSKTIVWSGPQLVRSLALCFLRYESPNRCLELNDAALQMSNDPGNMRSVATTRCGTQKHLKNFTSAWESIEPYYLNCRNSLFETVSAKGANSRDLVHLYSGAYAGACMRHIVKARYPTQDLADDIHALQWCQVRCGTIQMEDPVCHNSPPLPAGLQEIRNKSMRLKMDGLDVSTLAELVEKIRAL